MFDKEFKLGTLAEIDGGATVAQDCRRQSSRRRTWERLAISTQA